MTTNPPWGADPFVDVSAPDREAHLVPGPPPPLDSDAERDITDARSRLGAALPTSGFLGRYVRAAISLTSSPAEFHLLSAISAVSAVLGNRVCIENWGTRLYPNTWNVMVAPSGLVNKSTAIALSKRLITDAGLDVFHASDGSREGMLSEFAKKPAGLTVLDEFGAWLAANTSDYRVGTKENLTELYGGTDQWRRTLRSGDVVINRPALSILGATTVDWLEDRVTAADLRGGFLVRFMFLTAGPAERATNRDFSQWNEIERNRLIAAIRRIHRIGATANPSEPTSLELTDDARVAYTTWANAWEKRVEGDSRSELLSFAVRLRTAVLKLAIVYHASACAFDDTLAPLVVDARAMEAAIAFCELVWVHVHRIFETDFASDKDQRAMRMIVEIIGRVGQTRSVALKKSKMKARDFEQYVETLEQSGVIVRSLLKASELGKQNVRNYRSEWLEPGPASPYREQRGASTDASWIEAWDQETAAEGVLSAAA